MPFCPYCGKELSPDDTECPGCHAQIGMKENENLYCRGCGKEVPRTFAFCPYCGTRVDPVNMGRTNGRVQEEKNVFIAILLSLFVTGLGTIYAGNEKDGLILLIFMIACFVLGFIFVLPWVVCIFLWLYGLYDSYSKCEEFNKNLHNNS